MSASATELPPPQQLTQGLERCEESQALLSGHMGVRSAYN